MAISDDFLNVLGGGNTIFGAPSPAAPPAAPAAPIPPVPAGHVNAGGVVVPKGPPQPGQLGSPGNPLTQAQVEVLNAPNPEQFAGLDNMAQKGGIPGFVGNMVLSGGMSGNPIVPMNNMDYAQTQATAPPASKTLDVFGQNPLGGSGNLMADILNR